MPDLEQTGSVRVFASYIHMKQQMDDIYKSQEHVSCSWVLELRCLFSCSFITEVIDVITVIVVLKMVETCVVINKIY